MKKLNFLKLNTLRTKIALTVSLIVFFVIVVLLNVVNFNTRKDFINSVEENIIENGEQIAGKIESEIISSYTSLETLRDAILGISYKNITYQVSEELYSDMIENLLKENSIFTGISIYVNHSTLQLDKSQKTEHQLDTAQKISQLIDTLSNDSSIDFNYITPVEHISFLIPETKTYYESSWEVVSFGTPKIVFQNKNYNAEEFSYHTEILKKKYNLISKPWFNNVSGQPKNTVTLIIPIKKHKQIDGYITGNINLGSIYKLIKQKELENNNSIRLFTPEVEVKSKTNAQLKETTAEIKHKIERIKTGEFYKTSHDTVLQAEIPIKVSSDTYWQLTITSSKQNFLKALHYDLWLMRIVSFVLLAIALLVILYFSKRFLAPLEDLTEYADVIATGNLNYKKEIKSTGKELEKLKNTFDKLRSGFHRIADFALAIGQGNVDADYKKLSDKDVLGNALLNMRKSLKEAKKLEDQQRIENQQRNWASEGLAKFADILRQNNEDVQKLSYSIISKLVDYLKANQGGIFLLNVDNPIDIHLELIATYAYNRKRFHQKKIKMGEGLVGTCAVEKQPILMNDLPTDYIKITSGLGEARPRNLIIIPLKMDEEILGIIEIASFRKFEKHEIQFINDIAEDIASTLSAVKINERTAQLLQESQEQAEERSAQEEEMRQNLEELQATQEEASRRENEMKGFIEAINNTMLETELDKNGTIINANIPFLSTLKIKEHEIDKECNIMNLVHEKQREELLKKWQNLIENNQTIKSNLRIITKTQKEIWLSATFTPLLNDEGNLSKIILLAHNITDTKLKSLENNSKFNALDNILLRAELQTDSRFVYANQQLLAQMQSSEDEIIGRKAIDFIENQFKDEFNKIWTKIQKGEAQQIEIPVVTQKNKKLWFYASFNAIKNVDDQIEKIILLAHDITERKNQEQKLNNQQDILKKSVVKMQAIQKQIKTKENQLQKFIKAINMSTPYLKLDLKGTIIEVNEKFAELTGIPLNNLKEQKLIDVLIYTDSEIDEFNQLIKQVQQGKTINSTQMIINNKKQIWFNANYAPLYTVDNQIENIIIIAHDITNEKTIEKEIIAKNNQLKQQEKMLGNYLAQMEKIQKQNSKQYKDTETLIQNIGKVAICLKIDKEQNIISTNNLFDNLFNINQKQLKEQKYTDIVQFDNPNYFNTIWQDALKGKSQKAIFTLKIKNQTYWLQQHYIPVFDNTDEIQYILMLAVDITSSLRNEEILKNKTKEFAQKEEQYIKQVQELQQSQKELISSREELTTLKTLIDDFIFEIIINNKGEILKINNIVTKKLHYQEEELINKSITKITINAQENQKIKQLLNQKQSQIKELKLMTQNNQEITGLIHSLPIINDKGDIEKIIMLGIDISEQQKLSDENQKKQEQIKQIEQKLNEEIEKLKKSEQNTDTKTLKQIEATKKIIQHLIKK